MPAAAGPAEALLVILRWLHALAAIVFLGWTAVVWLDGAPRGDQVQTRQRFKEVTELSLLVFLATGAVLTFDSLSRGAGGGRAHPGTPAVRRVTFHYGPDQVSLTLNPYAGVDALYAPRRTVLDSLLVAAARRPAPPSGSA